MVGQPEAWNEPNHQTHNPNRKDGQAFLAEKASLANRALKKLTNDPEAAVHIAAVRALLPDDLENNDYELRAALRLIENMENK